MIFEGINNFESKLQIQYTQISAKKFINNNNILEMHQQTHRMSHNFENDPRHSNLPTELTQDGIRQLFMGQSSSTVYGQQFILQIIKIAQDFEQKRICQLSDGFCYVECVLTKQARVKNIQGHLQVFDVVRINRQDIIIMGLQRTPSIEICNLSVLGMRLLCTIGQPVAYLNYSHNNYVNNKGSKTISDGQKVEHALNIQQLISNFPHVPTRWILKAKIVKKPDNINLDKPFLVIKLMDEKENVIEGVFFGQLAVDANSRLMYGREYLFNNGQIKTKRNNNEQFQIKFTEQSQIIPIQQMKSTNGSGVSGEQNSENWTIKNITANMTGTENKLVNLNAKVFRIRSLSKGRSLEVIDANSDVIQVVLWEEIADQIKQGVTYNFINLRTKSYNSMISLQSVRSKTTISKSQVQMSRSQTGPKAQTKMTFSKCKQIRDNTMIFGVSQILHMDIKQRCYKDVRGFLIIPTQYMDPNHLFKLQCPKCNQYKQISANPLQCMRCFSNTPSIRWNLRCHIMDQKQDIKCVMNEQLCQSIFKMSSLQGFIKLNNNKEEMRAKLEEISGIEGVYRIKINPYKDNVYYNIVDLYKNDSRALLKKAVKQLKDTLKKFNAM